MKDNNKMRIAILGSRGIPNRYGGFEIFTQGLSIKLAKLGYQVFVSCESPKEEKKNLPSNYEEAYLFYFPIRPPKSYTLRKIYEVLYDGYSLLKASWQLDCDCVYMLGYAASIFFFIPKIFGKTLIVNADGLEWKRVKFSRLEKTLLLMCEKLMVVFSDKIIADSKMIKKYLDHKYHIKTKFIPYGVENFPKIDWDIKKLPEILKGKIHSNNYWLVVTRLEPENNIHTIINGYLASNSQKPLILIGDFTSLKYKESIKNILATKPPEKEVIFTGGIYCPDVLNTLRQNCFVYIHGHSAEGTSPALLEAMTLKRIIIAYRSKCAQEVGGDSLLYYKNYEELKKNINNIENSPGSFFMLKDRVYKRAKKYYFWNKIIKEYDDFFSIYKSK